MPTITLHIPFTPSPDAATLVIDDLGNPAHSINEIADANNTTVEAICNWMSQPEIAARLVRSDDVITWQTRRIASRALPDVARALVYILKDYCRSGGAPLQSRAHPADRNTLLRHEILEARRAETARRAAATLARLMKAPRIGPLSTLAAESAAPAAPRNPAPAPTPDPNTTPSAPNSPAAQDLLASLAGANLESLLSALAGLSNAPASDTAPQPPEAHQTPAPPHPNPTTSEPPRAAPAPEPSNSSALPPLQPIESLAPFSSPQSEIPNPQSDLLQPQSSAWP